MPGKDALIPALRRACDVFSRRFFLPLCFVFGDLYKLVLFYLGLAYKDSRAYRLIYAGGCALFALFCGILFLWVLRSERPAARLFPPASALLFFALAFLWGVLRGGAATVAYDLCLFLLRCLPVFFAGVALALRGGGDCFTESFERLGFIALPAGVIYFTGAIFDCNIFTDGRYLGLINYMSLAYTFMPVLLCMLFRFYDGAELLPPFPGARPLPHPQLWRGAMIIIFWIDIIASGTRGAYLCTALCCIAAFAVRLFRRRRALAGFALSAVMAAILIFCIFVWAPPGMRGAERMDIFFSGLEKGELTTTDTEDPAVSERIDEVLDGILRGESGGELELDPGVRISDRASIYKLAVAEFLRSPLFGMGACAFRARYGVYPHNIFLELLCEVGLFGTLPAIMLLCLAAVGLFSAARRRCGMTEIILLLFAYFVRESISNSIWQSVPVSAALGLGLALFALRRQKSISPDAGRTDA